ncbi:MAG: Holliday junction resolvase RuvX [Candidatus Magasanikbacteria bacterium]|nr:Holliday junction resolvase RuvX [Candidatus Magasanikbacteria bacterium]MBT4314641.1 Holliday junction resolvase RuvX [Candidatus Magasanikbacteria bacterium]MBT4547062.1 Holliday junction resolvase RuvX [Candidatus Magasanikbacteria bacterium]MBT6819522.1 Holliday junction resolvase RuvX [Candidatus Magasanikbacteria bacterium]
MNILGVDYGRKRIGLAWVQEGLDVVLPYGVVGSLEELVEFIKKERIDKVVLGLPLDMEEMTENDNTKRIRKFADEVKKQTGVEIDFADERLTTSEARQMGGDATLDEKAAMLILQTYLEE